MILDPLTGHLLDMGHTSYEPSARLARFVKTRDRRCVFPTCNRASQHCEIDHDRPYRPDLPGGGRTDRDNLHPDAATITSSNTQPAGPSAPPRSPANPPGPAPSASTTPSNPRTTDPALLSGWKDEQGRPFGLRRTPIKQPAVIGMQRPL